MTAAARRSDGPVRASEAGSAGDLMTPEEVAQTLRTSRTAVYAMVQRRQLPGVIRIGRRVRVQRGVLLEWLDQNRVPSTHEE